MRLLLTFLRAYPRRSAVLVSCLIAGGLAEGIGISGLLPFLGRAASGESVENATALERGITDLVRAAGFEPTMGTFLAIIVGGVLLKAVLTLIANRQAGYCVAHLATDLRLELLRALLGSRWQYYVGQRIGIFANSFATEAQRAAESYLRGTTILSLTVQSLVYFAVALMVSWQAAVLAVSAGLVMGVLLHQLVRMAKRAGAKQTALMREIIARLTDILQAIKPLKAMGREKLVGPLLDRDAQRLNKALRKKVLSRTAVKSLQDPMIFIFLAVGVFAAVRLADIALPSIIMLALLSERVISGSGKIQREYQEMVVDESAYWSIRATIDEAMAAKEVVLGSRPPRLERAITLDGVRFAYADRAVLDGFDLTIPAGELTVLVGASGAGKTTLADLIVGLAAPQAGDVRVDGVPLREIDTARWRDAIGYVPQETLLLHDSVRANVSLGDPDIDDDDVHAALVAAGIDDVVAELPDGLDTVVGERGLRLSGGQRQRLALARALVHKPTLLILDEATASLDAATEAGICASLYRLRGVVTLLAVCHHSALIDMADRVYRVEGGRAQLLATAGVESTVVAHAGKGR
jgi:ATP-binding cassette subfamily C protein